MKVELNDYALIYADTHVRTQQTADILEDISCQSTRLRNRMCDICGALFTEGDINEAGNKAYQFYFNMCEEILQRPDPLTNMRPAQTNGLPYTTEVTS